MAEQFTRWYLENTQGSHRKFYEVIHFPARGEVATRWGRIGAPKGQMKVVPGAFHDALAIATKKNVGRGYDLRDPGTTYPLSVQAEAQMNTAFHQGKDGALTLTLAVDSALKAETARVAAPPDDGVDRTLTAGTTKVSALDLLLARADNLVPLVVEDPLKHAVDIAEVRQSAEEWRTKIRRLDTQLETLDVLLMTHAH